MAVTIKDIARAAGVSHTTVSRALRGNPLIAPETVARIQTIAEDLGYVPNTVARGLKTNRSAIMGVMVRRIVDPFFAEVLHGIEDVLYAEGYSLFLASSNRDPERERAIIRTMSEHRVDGVLICSTAAGEEYRAQLDHFSMPSVVVNNEAAEEIEFSVYHDNLEGSRQIVDYLIRLGHRRIAYVGNTVSGRATADRLLGYKAALEAATIEVDRKLIVGSNNGKPEGGAKAAVELLALPELPTAVVCYNDMMAFGVIKTLQDAGCRIPEDCSVVGFDNIEMAAFYNPPLTTFDQPKYELGQLAAEMLLKLISQNAKKQRLHLDEPIVRLRGHLVERTTAAPPRR